VKRTKRRIVLVAMAVALAVGSCMPTVQVTWKERLEGALPPDAKAVSVLDFNSQVKYESGLFSSGTEADQTYGKSVATMLGERLENSGTYKLVAAEADLKKVLDNRDVMNALVNEGVMKADVKDKLQKLSGAQALVVGEVACSAKKDETRLPMGSYGTIPIKSISASVTANFRVYSVKSGDCILSKTITQSKTGQGWQTASQALMPLVTQCVDEFSTALMGGEMTRTGKMFGDSKELEEIIKPLDAGVSPDRVAGELDAYSKAHPDSGAALYDLGVIAFMKGDRAGADKMVEDAKMKPGADAKGFQKAYEEMQAGGAKKEGRRKR